MVIDAHAAGLIPGEQRELRDLIVWHTEPNSPPPDHVHAQYLLCPANLFHDIRGGGYVMVKAVADGQFHVVPDSEFGGLMPQMVAGHLEQPRHERDADTCDVLADLLESAGTSQRSPPPRLMPDEFDFGGGVIGREFTPTMLRLLQVVVDAGPTGLRPADAAEKLGITEKNLFTHLGRLQNRMGQGVNTALNRTVESVRGWLKVVTLDRPTKDPQK